MKKSMRFSRIIFAALAVMVLVAFPDWRQVLANVGGYATLEEQKEAEHFALSQFYAATNGDQWDNRSNWLGGNGTQCDWYGVFCNEEGLVNGISLEENNLTGYMPSEIQLLGNLGHLGLQSNSLNGNIPEEIANLTNLHYLDLFDNNLTGSLPSGLFSLDNLSEIHLSDNDLTGNIPSSVSENSSLTNLVLSNNELSGSIPDTFGGLTNLVYLGLDGNQLSGAIPAEIGGLSTLNYLYLDRNNLSGDIPDSIWGLTQLRSLMFYNNNLTGQIPATVGDISNLEYLLLQENDLTGILPQEIESLSSLKFLDLFGNNFAGSIPGGLLELEKLEHLNLSNNNFSGVLPSVVSENSALTHFFLAWNALTGSIPASYGDLTNLVFLGLEGNQLSGTLPAEIGSLANLEWFYANNNTLSGSVPSELSNLTAANGINLSYNQFSGAVPPAVTALGTVNLWANPGLTDVSFGGDSVCENQDPISLGNTVNGELTPYVDCYFEDERIMADFYRLDLTGETGITTFKVDAYSENFWPHMGVMDESGHEEQDIVSTQVQNNNLSFEVILPPGEYVLYIHGGNYESGTIAATGNYSLNTSILDEAQQSCTTPSWVMLGVELDGAISSNDCLDTHNDPDRLYDNYAIWLPQGDSVQVSVTSEAESQLLHFFAYDFNTSTGLIPAGQQQSLSYTASESGWHQFSVYNSPNNPLEENSYQISFEEASTFGDPSSCSARHTMVPGDSINTSLNQNDDCYSNQGRMIDFYQLNLDSDTFFTITASTDGFDPLLILSQGDPIVTIASRFAFESNSLTNEYYLPAGQYMLVATSRLANPVSPQEGDYTLSLSSALNLETIQGGCKPSSVIFPGASINAELTLEDCRDFSVVSDETSPYKDSFQFYQEEGQLTFPEFYSDMDVKLVHRHNGQLAGEYMIDGGEGLRLSLNRSGQHQFDIIGQSTDDLGSYELDLLLQQPELDTVPVEFSFNFNGYTIIGGEPQTGTASHVLTGIVDAVFIDDDIFEVVGIQEATLDGESLTIGDNPGIVAFRDNTPALLSLSGDLWDVLICPIGFSLQLDCPFGADGGFLFSDFPPPGIDYTWALAGHPSLGANYRARSVPFSRSSWSAEIVNTENSQYSVLETVYSATNGAGWTDNTGWLGEPGTECDWFGVSCNDHDQVTSLVLINNNLTGALPDNLSDLSELETLNLSNNQLTGQAPEGFDESVDINLEGNNFDTGSLPKQVISLAGDARIFLGQENTLSFAYNTSDNNAELTGIGLRVHIDSSTIQGVSFQNVLQTSLIAADSTWQSDSEDHDNNSETDQFALIAWSDISSSWPGSLPVTLFDLQFSPVGSLTTSDTVHIGFSTTSIPPAYEADLPALALTPTDVTLDVDGDGDVQALTDALMIVRSLFGFSGDSLISGAVSGSATFTTAPEIESRLSSMNSILDVDGNGNVDALTDGLLIMRYAFDFRGDVLISGAVGNDATRTNATDIENYIGGFIP